MAIRVQSSCWALIYFILGLHIKVPFKCYVTQMGWGGVAYSGKKRYEGVRFNVISVTRGGWGSNFQEKSERVTLEWPQIIVNEQHPTQVFC